VSNAPRQVLLFSGHMVDAPDRDPPRFPESAVPAAGKRVVEALHELGAGADDLGYTQGACGGDLLFTEACQSLGVPVQWMQPFDEDEFIQRSVALRGGHWTSRYGSARAKLDRPVLSMPAHLGVTAGDPFERCNQWLLERALTHGANRLRVIVLWNGQGGDGPGSTAHLMQLVRSLGREPLWIDTRQLGPDGN
jgi:hypothetical protein